MVLHDFECGDGHITEQSVESGTTKTRCGKDGCRKTANVVYLSPRISRAARNFEPALYFQDPSGEIWNPGRSDIRHLPKKVMKDLTRRGFQPRQITNFREYEKLKREQNARSRQAEQEQDHMERRLYEAELKEGLEALNRGFDMVREDGSTVHIRKDDFSGFGREFLEEALKHSEYESSQRGGDFFIQAMEYDSKKWEDRG